MSVQYNWDRQRARWKIPHFNANDFCYNNVFCLGSGYHGQMAITVIARLKSGMALIQAK